MKNQEYYGDETKKAINNFGEGRIPSGLIKSYAEVKKASIKAIWEYEKRFTFETYEIILEALDEIISGVHNDQFVVPLFQGGAGTSINMNMNEVIANLSTAKYFEKYQTKIKIDPIEDINRFQSTNDTFPTAATILVLRNLNEIEKNVIDLQETLIKKENEYENILLTGRTEMQDALPITLGQVFGSWAGMIARDRWRINKLKERVRNIALGGTAIGTSFFAPREYIFLAEKNLRNITGLSLARSQNFPDEVANLDKYSEVANGISLIAENLFKITGDLLLYTSSFINEIKHPNLQYGSTIMAAKTNPVVLEFVRGLSIDIQFECKKINFYAQNGQLQLNVYLPFVVNCFENIFRNIKKTIEIFITKFINNIEINTSSIENNLINSKAILNSLIALVGYNEVKKIYAVLEKRKIKNFEELKEIIALELKLEKNQIDDFFQPISLTTSLKL
ncbi:MAG TPA: lyase family protein [Spirochaetota bacterium]|nr:lyase family protein [Spirochaetota bacterium]